MKSDVDVSVELNEAHELAERIDLLLRALEED